MSRNIEPPISIEQQGLDNYLNRTAELHNGYGYDDFIKMLDSGLQITALGRVFNVSKQTAYKWKGIHNRSLQS